MAPKLVASIIGRNSTSDIVQVLSHTSESLQQVTEVLVQSQIIFLGLGKISNVWTMHLLGVTADIFRYVRWSGLDCLETLMVSLCRNKAGAMKSDDPDREILLNRQQTARDMVSISLCRMAFDYCRNGSNYVVGELIHHSMTCVY